MALGVQIAGVDVRIRTATLLAVPYGEVGSVLGVGDDSGHRLISRTTTDEKRLILGATVVIQSQAKDVQAISTIGVPNHQISVGDSRAKQIIRSLNDGEFLPFIQRMP